MATSKKADWEVKALFLFSRKSLKTFLSTQKNKITHAIFISKEACKMKTVLRGSILFCPVVLEKRIA